MLILVVGLLGLVLLPSFILLLPMFFWLLVPTVVGLASLGAVRAMKHQRRLVPAHP